MLRYLTAGESHGPMLTGIVEGLPAGLTIDLGAIDRDLARRQIGVGRSARRLRSASKTATLPIGKIKTFPRKRFRDPAMRISRDR